MGVDRTGGERRASKTEKGCEGQNTRNLWIEVREVSRGLCNEMLWAAEFGTELLGA